MTQQVVYVFCRECGGDTAMHTMSSRCPFCGAKQESLQVIADGSRALEQAFLMSELERVRSNWIQSGKSRRKRWFSKTRVV